MTLEQLRILVRVAQEGSFTRAADSLGTQKSHASRVISQLEEELGLKLFARSTRRLSITEAGQTVIERAIGILGAVDETLAIAQQARREPHGVLRLTCGVEFGIAVVNRWVQTYLERYPSVTVDADFTGRVLDIVHEGFDLAIRIGPLDDSRLASRPLGVLRYGLFASGAYLRQLGTPAAPESLAGHALLAFSAGQSRRVWTLRHEDGRELTLKVLGLARLRVNNALAVRDAAAHGMGIAMLPQLIAQPAVDDGHLVRVLPAWSGPEVPVHAVFPGNRYLTPKVRAFVDLAVDEMTTVPGSAAKRSRTRA